MLKRIKCDKFRTPIVEFYDGLNVIAGDSKAANSIGKSTMLMIIDFVFGGNSYITKNYDAIEALGHHTFFFEFVFNDTSYYFSRSTEKHLFVSYCDSQYHSTKEVKLSEYTELLKELYNLELPSMSFRDIVSLFSRIWGKKNYDIDKPLQISGENAAGAIVRFIKLCNQYLTISSLEHQIKELDAEKDALNAASKKSFLPSVTKTNYVDAQKRLPEIQKAIDEISTDLEGARSSKEAIISSEALELRSIKSQLIQQKSFYVDKLKHTQENLTFRNPSVKKQMERLVEFFPSINVDRLSSINAFHSNISSYLRDALKKAERELSAQVSFLSEEINKIDAKIIEILNLDNTSKYTVDRLLELAAQKDKLNQIIYLYEKKSSLEADLKKAKEDLSSIKTSILSEISAKMNTAMIEINRSISPDGRLAPSLQLEEKKYTFNIQNDTGTGKAYASLITLDLAVLQNTDLPILIHDTMLFKNIENTVFENMILLYSQESKQIFIAVDEIDKFREEAKIVLQKKSVLQLSYEKTLFLKDWKKRVIE